MKLLVLASTLDLRYRLGCTPAWWQLLKAFQETGSEVIAIPYLGDPVESPWWRTYENPCSLQSRLYNAISKSNKDNLEVWGDGLQTRSFCFVDDCTEGLVRIMDSGYQSPLNLGSEELVTVNELVDMACAIASKKLKKTHALSKPQGVRGRNSDNALLRKTIGWEPKTPLRMGMERTYQWIWHELNRQGRAKPPAPSPEKAGH